MANKKKNVAATGGDQPALRIGSRVRCTDDGVEGRITWANALSVKIKWDDGEQVTWKRDSLAERSIAILDPDEVSPPEAPAAPAAEEAAAVEVPQAEPETTVPEADATQPAAPAPEPPATESAPPAQEPAGTEPEAPAAGPAATEPAAPIPGPAPDQAGTSTEPAKPKRQRMAPAAAEGKKVRALDAAAKVLAEEGRPMSCKEMIGAMAQKGYWTSPGGQTPTRRCPRPSCASWRPRGTRPASPRSAAASSPTAPRGNPNADVAARGPRVRGLFSSAASRAESAGRTRRGPTWATVGQPSGAGPAWTISLPDSPAISASPVPRTSPLCRDAQPGSLLRCYRGLGSAQCGRG
jgi:hypothetical protein